ncbi:probable glutathione S-transferase GSTU1 [Lolium rigidum]|uniref:probable glutathione S-transferase GSTU1 n=1 Tax=Lolium rigidum TaxID=89674 RepID=UPI001F5E0AFF|nr:probable glutathione S-transferase GSTU1 [Lolium rigidum]
MEGSKGVVLLNCFVSPFGNRVRIALTKKGVEHEVTSENMVNKSALLLASNPVHAKVPVLLVAGKPVCESLVILEFIDEAFATSGEQLLPADAYARAQARFWAAYVDAKVPACAGKIWQSPPGAPAVEEGKKEMVDVFKTLEAELGEKAYFAGESLGFADVALVTFAPWFLTYERLAGFSIAEECPVLTAWAARCAKENECVSKSLPDPEAVFQFVGGMRKHFGLE